MWFGRHGGDGRKEHTVVLRFFDACSCYRGRGSVGMHHFRVVFCAFRKGFRSARVEPLASEATFLSDRIGVRDSSPPCFPRESSPAPPRLDAALAGQDEGRGSPWRPAAPARPPPDPSGRPRGRGAAIRPAAKAAGALEDDRRFGRIAELPRLPEVLEEPKIENLPQKLRKTRHIPKQLARLLLNRSTTVW